MGCELSVQSVPVDWGSSCVQPARRCLGDERNGHDNGQQRDADLQGDTKLGVVQEAVVAEGPDHHVGLVPNGGQEVSGASHHHDAHQLLQGHLWGKVVRLLVTRVRATKGAR